MSSISKTHLSFWAQLVVLHLLVLFAAAATSTTTQATSGASQISNQSDALSSNDIPSGRFTVIGYKHQQQQQQQHEKKGPEAAAALHHQRQNLNKLQKYLNERQRELVSQHPGSLLAVARALKMAIVECQYQMRNEPWDCPIHKFSVKPSDIFGKLVSRSFKETSFIRSLLSSAIAHSVARACTESMISCPRQLYGPREDEHVIFGQEFAAKFMNAMDESNPAAASPPVYASASTAAAAATMSNNIDKTLINNNMISLAGVRETGNELVPSIGANYHKRRHVTNSNRDHLQQQQGAVTSGSFIEREKKIRAWVNSHNDAVGRLQVIRGYTTTEKVCKCHGLSGACSVQSCWRKLPSFRDVANKLHQSFDEAVRLTHFPQSAANRRKSLTSGSYKKSNKKRSSSQHPVNGLARSSTSSNGPASESTQITNPYAYSSSNSLNSEPANVIAGDFRAATKRQTSADNCEDCHRAPANLARGQQTQHEARFDANNSWRDDPPNAPDNSTTPSIPVKKRPVARSIGAYEAARAAPSEHNLVYFEESPDFCVANEIWGFNGTKGRNCSENPNVSNFCTKLCCGRGYKTEVREEKYKCECQFKFCCKLDCNICTRRKIIHKCL